MSITVSTMGQIFKFPYDVKHSSMEKVEEEEEEEEKEEEEKCKSNQRFVL